MRLFGKISKKNFLIYGLGKSGISSFNYLKKKNKCFIFDDDQKKIEKKLKKFYISKFKLQKSKFDKIILSPGINIDNCQLSSYLKKNSQKIITDLDIFFISNPKQLIISVTGTNGKSTTCKLLYKILKNHQYDARLVGNIGNPILKEKNIKRKTIFIVETSSYQLAYTKYFKSNYSLILNISPDHLERHITMKNYVNTKLKSVTMQNEHGISILPNISLIKKILKTKNIKSRIIFTKKNNFNNLKNKIKNKYFQENIKFQNLIFLFVLVKHLNLDMSIVLKTINKFKPLKFRQELIYDSKKIKIINDSKSTTLSSTTPFLKSNNKIYWILGGLFKKGDKFNLEKKYYRKLKVFIYGRDQALFSNILKRKLKIYLSDDLENSIKLISKYIKIEKKKITILFSPAAASFDQFKNFEHRGKRFNSLIKKYLLN
tara:strand:- start:2643 stop:3932 length:1290 start_codon:yes stop_codon:yes gene_type:complete